MEERYRLIFRGEVLEGQHPAVVKKRLLAALKMQADAMEQLFSGKAIVLKRDTDTKTAARLQAVFKTAGARLRVLPVESSDSSTKIAPASNQIDSPAKTQTEIESSSPAVEGEPDLLPVGSDLLAIDERTKPVTAQVVTDHISVAEVGENIEPQKENPPPNLPDTSQLTVAEPGVNLLEKIVEKAVEQLIERITTDFELLDVGVDLSDVKHAVEPEVDVDQIQFDVAEPGSPLGVPIKGTIPKAPDTSHITLES